MAPAAKPPDRLVMVPFTPPVPVCAKAIALNRSGKATASTTGVFLNQEKRICSQEIGAQRATPRPLTCRL
jgi:hypothetical protein